MTFVNCVEGIFYETAAVEAERNGFDFDYGTTVQYPFGYGMSYTTFGQAITDFDVSGDTVTAEVTVANTGDVAGKDVVELYDTPPYVNGGKD